MRCTDQPAIQPVRPCVIRTLNRGQMSVSVFAKSGATVSAYVVKAMHFSAFITNDDQNFARDLRDKIIAGFGDLTLMPNQHPLLGENLLLLPGKNLRRNKVLLRERFCPGRERLSRLAKCRDHREA